MTTTNSHNPIRTVEMTLRMPPDMAKAVTNSARALSMTKSDFVRKSVKRNLEYCFKNEIQLIEGNSRIKEALAVDLTGCVR